MVHPAPHSMVVESDEEICYPWEQDDDEQQQQEQPRKSNNNNNWHHLQVSESQHESGVVAHEVLVEYPSQSEEQQQQPLSRVRKKKKPKTKKKTKTTKKHKTSTSKTGLLEEMIMTEHPPRDQESPLQHQQQPRKQLSMRQEDYPLNLPRQGFLLSRGTKAHNSSHGRQRQHVGEIKNLQRLRQTSSPPLENRKSLVLDDKNALPEPMNATADQSFSYPSSGEEDLTSSRPRRKMRRRPFGLGRDNNNSNALQAVGGPSRRFRNLFQRSSSASGRPASTFAKSEEEDNAEQPRDQKEPEYHDDDDDDDDNEDQESLEYEEDDHNFVNTDEFDKLQQEKNQLEKENTSLKKRLDWALQEVEAITQRTTELAQAQTQLASMQADYQRAIQSEATLEETVQKLEQAVFEKDMLVYSLEESLQQAGLLGPSHLRQVPPPPPPPSSVQATKRKSVDGNLIDQMEEEMKQVQDEFDALFQSNHEPRNQTKNDDDDGSLEGGAFGSTGKEDSSKPKEWLQDSVGDFNLLGAGAPVAEKNVSTTLAVEHHKRRVLQQLKKTRMAESNQLAAKDAMIVELRQELRDLQETAGRPIQELVQENKTLREEIAQLKAQGGGKAQEAAGKQGRHALLEKFNLKDWKASHKSVDDGRMDILSAADDAPLVELDELMEQGSMHDEEAIAALHEQMKTLGLQTEIHVDSDLNDDHSDLTFGHMTYLMDLENQASSKEAMHREEKLEEAIELFQKVCSEKGIAESEELLLMIYEQLLKESEEARREEEKRLAQRIEQVQALILQEGGGPKTEGENEGMEQVLNELKSDRGARRELNLDAFTSQVNRDNAAGDGIAEELLEANEKVKEQEKQLAHMRAELDGMKGDAEAVAELRVELQKHLDGQEATVNDLKEELKTSLDKLNKKDETIAFMQEQIQQLSTQMAGGGTGPASTSQRVRRLERELAMLQKEKQDLENRYELSRMEIEELVEGKKTKGYFGKRSLRHSKSEGGGATPTLASFLSPLSGGIGRAASATAVVPEEGDNAPISAVDVDFMSQESAVAAAERAAEQAGALSSSSSEKPLGWWKKFVPPPSSTSEHASTSAHGGSDGRSASDSRYS